MAKKVGKKWKKRGRLYKMYALQLTCNINLCCVINVCVVAWKPSLKDHILQLVHRRLRTTACCLWALLSFHWVNLKTFLFQVHALYINTAKRDDLIFNSRQMFQRNQVSLLDEWTCWRHRKVHLVILAALLSHSLIYHVFGFDFCFLASDWHICVSKAHLFICNCG